MATMFDEENIFINTSNFSFNNPILEIIKKSGDDNDYSVINKKEYRCIINTEILKGLGMKKIPSKDFLYYGLSIIF